MELLQGVTLAELLRQRGALPLHVVQQLLGQACDGVAAAHAVGIVHRDLKPENLFLCGPDCSFVKIIDFGVSKFDPATTGVGGFTVDGTPIGTPFYMAPEQVIGEKNVDGRVDVYALGVVLYECLTGLKPFTAESLPHLAILIHQGRYLPPSQARAGLPASVDHVVASAMASDRAQRFATASELGRAIASLRTSQAPAPFQHTQFLAPSPSMVPAKGPSPTPAVFEAPAKPAPQKSSKVWAVAAALGAVAVGAVVMLRPQDEPTRPPKLTTHAAASQALPEPSVATALPAPPPPSASAVAAPAAPRVVAPKPALVVASAAPKAGALAPVPAVPAPAPAAPPPPATRASAYGLSQGNPFR